MLAPYNLFFILSSGGAAYRRTHQGRVGASNQDGRALAVERRPEIPEIRVVARDQRELLLHRHFDRSAAEWRNLVPVGARFLHSAVLRTAPVEMTGWGRAWSLSASDRTVPVTRPSIRPFGPTRDEGDLLAPYNLFFILSSGGAAYRRTHQGRVGASNQDGRALAVERRPEIPEIRVVARDQRELLLHRHFDRSAAEWRNLVPVGARFLHSAVLRTAPVEMTGWGRAWSLSASDRTVPVTRPSIRPFGPTRDEGDLLAPHNMFLILSSGGAAYRRTHQSRVGASNQDGRALAVERRPEIPEIRVAARDRRELPLHRHFDRSAAEWRNLVPVGARFLHSAVLRTAPVEMTGLGAGLEPVRLGLNRARHASLDTALRAYSG